MIISAVPKIVTLGFLCLLPVTNAWASCTLYEHRDFGGGKLFLSDNERVRMINNTGDGVYARPDWNDRVSSYRVGRNCTLFMWEHAYQGGWKLTRGGELSYIGNRRNDKVSEALCSC
jgi:syncollin